MSVPAESIEVCFAKADQINDEKIPYVYGGGQNFVPSATAASKGLKGYDCRGAACAVLHAAGLIASVEDTEELAGWGDAGEGQYMTLWVANYPTLHHCALEFRLPEHPGKRWWMAAHQGTLVGWVPNLPDNWVLTPFLFAPRRRA